VVGNLIDIAAREMLREDKRIYGVALAEVVSNADTTGLGRVQLKLPWLPGYQPWARVVAFSAGSGRGGYFIPQEHDEVLVAFNQGDVRDPYVIGSLWNGRDKPPYEGTLDPVQKRTIRTPAGHTVLLDDSEQSVTVTTSTGQKLTLKPDRIELAAGSSSAGSKITLLSAGTIQIEATTKVEIKAPTISVNASGSLDLKASANATLDGGGLCAVKGTLVNIN
jgi:uncharacterized protein involved in type VI secretion and phage assembly